MTTEKLPGRMTAGSIILQMVLLTGCHSGQKAPPMPDKLPPPTDRQMQDEAEKQCRVSPGVSHDDCLYFAKLQYGIQHNFYDVDRYKGRQCAVTIAWQNGRYSVLNTTGDELLCLKAWGVVSSAENLPPPPKQIPPKMVLEFRPQ
ncbi:cell envelope integrity TolA C-terminal domain-containing protein [Erwinia typographi]|uniref:cell envelope integrity TolA C-terminal domain-containing protein n=1 Tax=Erwinia typographi TaxID=371042 RepID=UPI0009FFE57C|nr:cell envelope integrity TolA C-terminal domain-containing protein [Erwinia typographi]